VVIAILALLVVGLVQLLERAREHRHRVACQENLRQIGLAFKMYAQDWDGMYPPKKRVLSPGDTKKDRFDPVSPEGIRTLHLVPEALSIYPEYLTDLSVFICPSEPAASALQTEWQEIEKSGGETIAVCDFIDKCSYDYTGYVACTGYYDGTFVKADAQFLGLILATQWLHWQDFDSDIVFPEGFRENFNTLGSRHNGTIYRLREGIGQLMVTDPAAGPQIEDAASRCAVMWDKVYGLWFFEWSGGMRLVDRLPAGGNVLFLDGHVEFVEFPGEFPMTMAVADGVW
jgi:prepilin-type processing-associated H-X9-DG protein